MDRQVKVDWTAFIGKRFGNLTVVRIGVPFSDSRRSTALVAVCVCGNEKTFRAQKIRSGLVPESCGCIVKARMRLRLLAHGCSKVPGFSSWVHMHYRCSATNTRSFKDYGGRGIRVCESWFDVKNFFFDMGPKPSQDHSIERIDVNGNYEPTNCRWLLNSKQAANRRNTVFITFNNESVRRLELVRRCGLTVPTLNYRLKKLGWSMEKALTTPMRKWHPGTKSTRYQAIAGDGK